MVCLAGVGANDDPSSVAVIGDAVGDTPRWQYKPLSEIVFINQSRVVDRRETGLTVSGPDSSGCG